MVVDEQCYSSNLLNSGVIATLYDYDHINNVVMLIILRSRL